MTVEVTQAKCCLVAMIDEDDKYADQMDIVSAVSRDLLVNVMREIIHTRSSYARL